MALRIAWRALVLAGADAGRVLAALERRARARAPPRASSPPCATSRSTATAGRLRMRLGRATCRRCCSPDGDGQLPRRTRRPAARPRRRRRGADDGGRAAGAWALLLTPTASSRAAGEATRPARRRAGLVPSCRRAAPGRRPRRGCSTAGRAASRRCTAGRCADDVALCCSSAPGRRARRSSGCERPPAGGVRGAAGAAGRRRAALRWPRWRSLAVVFALVPTRGHRATSSPTGIDPADGGAGLRRALLNQETGVRGYALTGASASSSPTRTACATSRGLRELRGPGARRGPAPPRRRRGRAAAARWRALRRRARPSCGRGPARRRGPTLLVGGRRVRPRPRRAARASGRARGAAGRGAEAFIDATQRRAGLSWPPAILGSLLVAGRRRARPRRRSRPLARSGRGRPRGSPRATSTARSRAGGPREIAELGDDVEAMRERIVGRARGGRRGARRGRAAPPSSRARTPTSSSSPTSPPTTSRSRCAR